jgi:hypothetical protein
MFIQAPQGPLHGLLWEAVSGIVLSIGGYIVLFPIRTLISGIKDKWDAQVTIQAEQTKALEEVKTELVQQRTNCLATLTSQGDKQIDLLKDAVKVLNDMHLDQRTLLGKLDK